MDSYKQRDIGDTMSTSVNATAAVASPSNATAAVASPSNATAAVASPSNATVTNVICCKNLSKDGDKDKPKHIQDTPIRLVRNGDMDYEKSSSKGERSSESFAEEIQLNIDYLYSGDSDNLDSVILDNNEGAKDRIGDENENENNVPSNKEVGNYEAEGDGLHDIKNTIENALS